MSEWKWLLSDRRRRLAFYVGFIVGTWLTCLVVVVLQGLLA